MDAIKAISFGLSGINFMQKTTHESIPIICVCTASGTGSEITQYCILTDNIK